MDNIRYQAFIVSSFGCHRKMVIASVAEKESSMCQPTVDSPNHL